MMANHLYDGPQLGTVLMGLFAGDRLVYHERVAVLGTRRSRTSQGFSPPPNLTLTHVVVDFPGMPVRVAIEPPMVTAGGITQVLWPTLSY